VGAMAVIGTKPPWAICRSSKLNTRDRRRGEILAVERLEC
jgi:hypothetical protein